MSSSKNVSLQHKTRSSVGIAINLLICSVIPYLEMNSRDYLVASDEHIRLYCDIAFGVGNGQLRQTSTEYEVSRLGVGGMI